jgi:hypothetical protein
MRGLGLWGLTLLSTILQLYDGGQIYCWKNPVYPEKTPAAGHLQNLSHNVVSSKPRHERDSDSQVVINADCTDNWKSNYHTMKTTTVSFFMRSNWQLHWYKCWMIYLRYNKVPVFIIVLAYNLEKHEMIFHTINIFWDYNRCDYQRG